MVFWKRMAVIGLVFGITSSAVAEVSLYENQDSKVYIRDNVIAPLASFGTPFTVKQYTEVEALLGKPFVRFRWVLTPLSNDREAFESSLAQNDQKINEIGLDMERKLPLLACGYRQDGGGPTPFSDGAFVRAGGEIQYAVEFRREIFSVVVQSCEGICLSNHCEAQ